MTLETRDIIAIGSVLVAIVTMLVVSRNARSAHTVQLQNTDLTRIRDLRSELSEVRTELKAVRTEAAEMRNQLVETHEFANRMMRERMEMIRYAQMPGVDIHDWLDRYGDTEHPRPIGS